MIARTPTDMKAIARQVADVLRGGENLLLYGDLGAGKTTFVQGLAEGLGVTEPVKSPTYIYLREYVVPLRSTKLAHFDLHRLPEKAKPSELDSVGLPERLADQDVITVIEWSERLAAPPADSLAIGFKEAAGGGRELDLPDAFRRRVAV